MKSSKFDTSYWFGLFIGARKNTRRLPYFKHQKVILYYRRSQYVLIYMCFYCDVYINDLTARFVFFITSEKQYSTQKHMQIRRTGKICRFCDKDFFLVFTPEFVKISTYFTMKTFGFWSTL